MDDVYAYIEVPEEGLKKVLLIGSLDDIGEVGSLDDIYVTLTNGKKALAVASIGSGSIPNPSRLNTYLPAADSYTTPTLVAGIPTKVLVPTTVKTINNFTLDVVNERYFLDESGAVDKEFSVNVSLSVSSSTSNHLVTIEMYKNGALEEGVGIQRWIAAGSDLGAIAINGTVLLSDTDYIEVYVTDSAGGTLTLERLSININEKLGAL